MMNTILGILALFGLAAFLRAVDTPSQSEQNAINQQAISNMRAEWEAEYYKPYCEAFTACARANYNSLEIQRPTDLVGQMVNMNNRVRWSPQYGLVLCYRLKRADNGNVMTGEHKYSTKDREEIAKELNISLGNYCIEAGLVPFRVVQTADIENHYMAFALAPENPSWVN